MHDRPLRHGARLVLFGVATLLAQPRAGRADSVAQATNSSVEAYYGAFSTEVPIELPPFHGIEPRLKLQYASNAGNSFVGVGWGLAGVSMIERTAPNGGAPHYDANDEFRLDGQRLIKCAPGDTSPACTTCPALTVCYSTRIQSYNRIQLGWGTWMVTQKNGTRHIYSLLAAAAGAEYRWGLTWSIDTSGNEVAYGWACADGDCYLDNIKYGRTTVKLYREARPDPITFATGNGIGTTAYRLKSIDVLSRATATAADQRARAYKLTYATLGSGRSRLASVTPYGQDATLDAAGAITAGTSLPPMAYSAPPATKAFGVGSTWGNYTYPLGWERHAVGDVNGDGFADMVYLDATGWTTCATEGGTCTPGRNRAIRYGANGRYTHVWTSAATGCNNNNFGDPTPGVAKKCEVGAEQWMVRLGSATGFAAPVAWITFDPTNAANTSPGHWPTMLQDMNGDGRLDILQVSPNNQYRVWLTNATGTGFLPPTTWAAHPGTSPADTYFLDLNADGKTDLLYVVEGGGYDVGTVYARMNTGTTFAAATTWASFDHAYHSYEYCGESCSLAYDSTRGSFRLADFTGDGRPDLAFERDNTLVVMENRGATATATTWGTMPAAGRYSLYGTDWSYWWPADLNGDGKSDLLYLDAAGNLAAMLSTGTAFTAGTTWGGNPGASDAGLKERVWVFDANKDGRDDFMYGSATGYVVALSTGTKLATGTQWAAYPTPHATAWKYVWRTDLDGDGLQDILFMNDTVGFQALRNLASSELMTTLANGMGATTTVSYAPSTKWANTLMPPGMVLSTVAAVTTSDGRGASGTTSYTYAGGLWSWTESQFLGFRKVSAVIDAAGDYTETYYHQHAGCISKPETTYFRDATGKIYSYSSMTYSESATAPYTSLLTERWDYDCNLDTACRRVVTQLGYDVYGNVILTKEHGDYDRVGDERTTDRGFSVNTTAYIVGLQAYENVRAGIGSTGALMAQTLMLYDGATATTTAPTTGLLTAKKAWNSKTGGYVTTGYGYDARGNNTSTTDGLGAVSTTTFDTAWGLDPIKECNALGHCTSSVWDHRLGVITSRTDANGQVTTLAYDNLRRPVSETAPDGGITKYERFDLGSPSLQRTRKSVYVGGTPSLAASWVWVDSYHDGLGRNWKEVRSSGATRQWVFSDGGSRVWKESAPYGAGETAQYEVYAYDGAGRLRTVTHPDGTKREWTYGDDSVTTIDELGHQRTQWHDGFGQVVQVTEQNGTASYDTFTDRDALGRVVKVTDELGHVSTTTWTSLGAKATTCDADLGCWSYEYDLAGHQTKATDAKGQVLQYTYDALGRRRTETGTGVSTTWTYDEANHGASKGRLTTVTFVGGSTSTSYDATGRANSETRCVDTVCKTMTTAYDVAGRAATITYPDSEAVAHTYDGGGRLKSVGGYVTSLLYDARDQLTTITLGNGVTQSFTYDPKRRWLTRSLVAKAGATLYDAAYTYDAAARVKTAARWAPPTASQSFSYAYDDLDRLLSVSGAQSQTFAYDAIGNMTSNSGVGAYTYASAAHPHAVTAAGPNSYTYDANGNMLTGAGRTLTWDVKNRLVAMASGGSATTVAYGDGEERVKESTSAGTTRYLGGTVDVDAAGNLVKYYFAGPVRVARKVGTTLSYYHADRLGSTQLLTDGAGTKVRDYDYRPYGEVVATSGTISNEIKFGGHRSSEADLGLVYAHARYYNPILARFVSADTMVPDDTNPQALNRYAFAYNNPVSNVDPTGHAPVVVAAIAAIAADTAIGYIGFALITAGYFLDDPVLMSVGQVCLGYAGGGPLGALVSAATSPISPLDPNVKQSIGWAYSAYNLFGGGVEADPERVKGLKGDWQARSDEYWLETGRDLATDLKEQYLGVTDQAFDTIQTYQESVNRGYFGSTAHRAFASGLSEATGGAISVGDAMMINPAGGFVGPDFAFGGFGDALGGVAAIGRHGVVHDLEGFLYTAKLPGGLTAGVGPGYVKYWSSCAYVGHAEGLVRAGKIDYLVKDYDRPSRTIAP